MYRYLFNRTVGPFAELMPGASHGGELAFLQLAGGAKRPNLHLLTPRIYPKHLTELSQSTQYAPLSLDKLPKTPYDTTPTAPTSGAELAPSVNRTNVGAPLEWVPSAADVELSRAMADLWGDMAVGPHMYCSPRHRHAVCTLAS